MAAFSALALAFASLALWHNAWHAQDWMTATHAQVFQAHQWWRAWTTLLAHANMGHLSSNSLLFFILGIFLYEYFGFWIFPLGAFAVGGVMNLLVLWTMPPDVTLLGASGVVFWMGGFWLTLYAFLERGHTVGERSLRVIGVALALFMPAETFDPGISYLSHLLGFVLGLLSGLFYFYSFRQRLQAAEVIESVIEPEEFEHDQSEPGQPD